ncbi:IS5 family transposase [Streptomyces sp. NPDC018352]|uniref:IS5 family transposase n=1 Tax=Streptomyces sp. NPDC018352 TaxID=3157194 RepID=UPI0033DDA2DD
MSEHKPYQSDLTDEQWALIEAVLTAWKNRHRSVSGHQGRYSMREIVNSILYQSRTGCQWALLPNDLPPKSATYYYHYYYYFAAWRDDGTDQQIHELLRCQVRERGRRLEDPTLVILDTQSVRAATGVPLDATGKDAAKRVPGRKRGLAVDVLGLVIAVTVLAASVHDNAASITLLDQGFKNQVVTHGAALGIDVGIIQRNPEEQGFVPQPKRWRVEQTFGSLILHRRLARDYEHRPAFSASRVYWAMNHVMARRLTDTNTLTWRDPRVAGA